MADAVVTSKPKLVTVRVQPSSKKAKIEVLGPTDFKVHVFSPAEKGAANGEMVRALADYFRLPASRIRIVRGERSRIKLVAVKFDE